MKTENFDDAIRKKIENVNVQYSNDDVDRVYKYVNRKKRVATSLNFFWIGIASVGFLTIAGLLLWNISQFRANKKLLLTIDNLKLNNEKTNANITSLKTDTIFITKNIVVSSADKVVAEKKSGNTEDNNLISENEGSSANKMPGMQTTKHSKVTAENMLFANNSTDYKTNPYGKDKNDSDKFLIKKNALSNQHVDFSNKVSIRKDSTLSASTEFPKKDTIADLKNNSVKRDTVFTANENHPVSKKDILSTADYTNSHHHVLSLKDWHYGIGAGIEKTDDQSGYTFSGEVFFNRKWSASVGLKLSESNNNQYGDDDDFSHNKGQHFQDAYEYYVSGNSYISKIKIHTALIQLPVIINYNLLLKNNFSLLMGIGTDVDLYAKQNVQYDQNANNTEETKNFKCKCALSMFNNIMLSTGIQKKWKQFILHASIYVCPQLTPVLYKDNDLDFGLRLKAIYVFGGKNPLVKQ